MKRYINKKMGAKHSICAKKNLFLTPVIAISLVGCSSQPTCDAAEVEDKLFDLAKRDESLITSWIYNYSAQSKDDLSQYESSRSAAIRGGDGLAPEGSLDKILSEYSQKVDKHKEDISSSLELSLQNIITTDKDEKVGYVSCKADLRGEAKGYGWAKRNELRYQVEKTSDGELVVKAFY